ncbi:MAG: 50S ribosomal protein L29 [bacterium]|jgi:ribosomal protein L29
MKSKKELEFLRSLEYQDLVNELRKTKKEYFDNKFKMSISSDFKPHILSLLRKKIARIKYFLSTKKNKETKE